MRHILKGNGDIINTNSCGFEFLNAWSQEFPHLSVQKEKTFRITKNVYRKIAGAAKELFLTKKNKITFWTITSPEVVEHKIFNNIISDFLENLRKNYGLNGYIGVSEYQERGAIHYHFLFDCPFIDVGDLGGYLIRCGGRYNVRFENNSIRLPPCGAVVQSQESIVNYICKYMSKANVTDTIYKARCYFISRNLIRKDIVISTKEHEELVNSELLAGQTQNEYISITHTSRKIDVYDIFRKKRAKERVFYDDFMQREQHRLRMRAEKNAKQQVLPIFESENRYISMKMLESIQFLSELGYGEYRKKIEKYEKWKADYIKRIATGYYEHRKKEKNDTICIVRSDGKRIFKDLYDRQTGEFVRNCQWFKVYSFRKKSEKVNAKQKNLTLC